MNYRFSSFALFVLVATTGIVRADVRTVVVDATKPPAEFTKKYRISIERERGRHVIVLSYASRPVTPVKAKDGADASWNNDGVLEGCWMALAASDGSEVLGAPIHFVRGADGRTSARITAGDRFVGRLKITLGESFLQGGRGRTYYQIHFKNVVAGNEKAADCPAKTSRYQVKLIGIDGVNTRRFSCSVSFEVVEVIRDAFASTPLPKGSSYAKEIERFKQGSPIDGKLSTRLYGGSDVQSGKDSITRLLTFFGAKVDGYVRNVGRFKIEKKEKLWLTVTQAKDDADIRWELEDQKGRRVTINPYKPFR